jgi:exodeoxyribonuclease V gamma subunit
MFLLHPSPILWKRVHELLPAPPRRLRRADDPTVRLPENRLLASWGRDSRELQLVLAGGGATADHHHPLDDPPASTLLSHLQAAVRDDRRPPGLPLPGRRDERLPLDPADDSVLIHACHGRQRQVEVLREAILHRLAADPTLEPRDVIVMCPDIETFAPLIHAAFGGGREAEDELGELAPVDLRVRLADRALRQTNPVLGLVARLLELARARVTASELLDLADTDPVRRRFGLDDEDLARIGDWIVSSGIHWGLGAQERSVYGLSIEEGTWRAGLRRVLLGTSMSEEGQRMFGGVLPVDDVDSGDIDLAGRFAELVDRLAVTLHSLRGPHTAAGWAQVMARAADALTATTDSDARQRQELRRILDDLASEASGESAALPLELPEVRALLADRLAGRPTRANFRTGHLTVCTLVPMRSVPHRVVCLLGLDDGAFPRRTARHGDDLRLADPHVGDRDPRAEDRQLLLDALLAAQDAVIVTYSGHDERTNAELPPAVPIGELLDAVDATAFLPDDPEQPARSQILVTHPLQPFDPRNFAPGRLCRTGPWSFDRVALAGARALESERHPAPPFVSAPLPPLTDTALTLSDLIAFVERPVQAFLRQRLGVATGSFEDEIDDALPVELDGLSEWGVGQRLLEAVLAGAGGREACLAEVARGQLPPGALGRPVIARVWPEVEALVGQARAHAGSADPRSLETNFRLPCGAAGGELRITGTVTGVYDRVVLGVAYSRLAAKHRLAAWVRLLALSAAHPEVQFEAVTIGRADKRADARLCIAHVPALGSSPESRRARALVELGRLAELRALGLREPLPLPCATAAAWSEAVVRRRAQEVEARAAACDEWESGWSFPKENAADEHVLAFGPGLSIDDLLAFTARDGDPGETSEARRFVRLAEALWRPLLATETVSSL